MYAYAQSSLAGTVFIILGLQDKKHVGDVGGYTIFGAFYFFIGAILLNRKLSKSSAVATS